MVEKRREGEESLGKGRRNPPACWGTSCWNGHPNGLPSSALRLAQCCAIMGESPNSQTWIVVGQKLRGRIAILWGVKRNVQNPVGSLGKYPLQKILGSRCGNPHHQNASKCSKDRDDRNSECLQAWFGESQCLVCCRHTNVNKYKRMDKNKIKKYLSPNRHAGRVGVTDANAHRQTQTYGRCAQIQFAGSFPEYSEIHQSEGMKRKSACVHERTVNCTRPRIPCMYLDANT